MVNISNDKTISKREVFYQRQRTKNRFFSQITTFFSEEAARENITKRELARRIACDPAQITRWLTVPSNMTIEGISDILLSLGAETELHIVKFSEAAKPNYEHPLITAARSALSKPERQTPPFMVTGVSVGVAAWVFKVPYNVEINANVGAVPVIANGSIVTGVHAYGVGSWLNQTKPPLETPEPPPKTQPYPGFAIVSTETSTPTQTLSR